jgi:streptogramin lyase
MSVVNRGKPLAARMGIGLVALSLVISACGVQAGGSQTVASAPSSPFATPTPTATPSPTPTPAPTMPPIPVVESVTPEAAWAIDSPPGYLLDADGSVWAGDASAVTRIDPASGAVQTIEIRDADGIRRSGSMFAVGFDSIWVGDWDFGKLYRFDAESGELQATLEMSSPTSVVVTGDAVWVTNHHEGTLSRVDPATNKIVTTVVVTSAGESGPHQLLVDGDLLWVGIPRDYTVAEVDATTNALVGTIPVDRPGEPCGALAMAADRLYVTGCWTAPVLAQLDPAEAKTVGVLEAAGFVNFPTVIGERLWATMEDGPGSASGSIVRINPDGPAIEHSIGVTGGYPNALLEAFGSVWLSVAEPEIGSSLVLRLPRAAFD